MAKPQKSNFPDPLAHLSPRRVGVAGGTFSSLVQFFGSTLDDVVTAAFDWDILALKLFFAFLLGLGGFAFCGGMLAHYLQGKYQNRTALFLAAAIATSAGGTAIPGIGKIAKRFVEAPISTAYASTEARAETKTDTKACDDISAITVVDGLMRFLGLEEISYRVVVGSFKRPDDARDLINKINAGDPTLSAYVGDRAPCNEFYPVIVGPNATTLYQAKKIKARAAKLEFITDTYISNRSR